MTTRAVVPTATWSALRAFSSSTPAAYEHSSRPERPRNPPSETLFVGNVPWDATAADLQRIFADFGVIVGEVRVPIGFDGRSRGFAHVTYSDVASAQAAVSSASEEPLHLNGRDLVLDYASARSVSTKAPVQPNNKVYYTNFEQGEAALRELLSEHEADILSVYQLRDGNTGAPLASGFVEFSSVDVAQSVIKQFNGQELDSGATLSISYARPRKERTEGSSFSERRGGGARRGGGGGGGGGHYSNRGYNSRNDDY
ncbi:hypothetical protein HYPSUDRAFT_139007 [Hypholoma sublateritium FD-334 SS-4]|uniref:RRM domain-containing protein n=1 Tax=Hypholoma sublateritium (strain FD-334 SS-4) TaxID=945553 RepID=A0A0D2MG74_HYPSF|nr:hypothetical protein HYPSUDRAFT_139007 [Hypholoma sublateritium FD-334 SS-4]